MKKFMGMLAVAGISLMAVGQAQAVGLFRYTTTIANQPAGFTTAGLYDDPALTIPTGTANTTVVGAPYGLGGNVYSGLAAGIGANVVEYQTGTNFGAPFAGNVNFGGTQITPVNLITFANGTSNSSFMQKIRIFINVYDVTGVSGVVPANSNGVGTFTFDGILNVTNIGPGVAVSNFVPGGFVGPTSLSIGTTQYNLSFLNYTPFQQLGATNNGAIAFFIQGGVPEPGTFALLLGAMVPASILVRRRRK